MKQYKMMDPEMIMSVVISLIILAVGVFAFWVTLDNIPQDAAPSATSTIAQNNTYNTTHNALGNISGTGNQVFNIVGVVLVIGAIMTIVGLVYSYVKPGGY